jgi:hypothetical protein
MTDHDPLIDHRSRLELELQEAAERRSQALLEQSSPDHTPAQRVSVWERLHQVYLPRDPQHNVLRIVARQTGLSLADVREVQRLRAAPPELPPAEPPPAEPPPALL